MQARERRDGVNKDYDEQAELQSTTADYRAVAPDAKMSVAVVSCVENVIYELRWPCTGHSSLVMCFRVDRI